MKSIDHLRKHLWTSTIPVFVLLVSLLPDQCIAAVDGDLDDSSEGDVQVSLSILPSIQLQQVDDIRLNITDRRVDNDFEQSFCISGNQYGKYTLTATGSSQNESNYVLYNNNLDELPYLVFYKGDRQKFDPINPGESSKVYDVAPYTQACEQPAFFKIVFRSEDLLRVKSGLYTGSLTITISPL